MEISRRDDSGREAVSRSGTFTGTVWGMPLLAALPDMTANEVLFAPGARTDWHRHEGGQILHITEGQGKVRSRGGEEAIVGAGDTVWVPPGEEHYHGADLGRFLIHLAFSFGETQWLDPVSDEEYGAAGGSGA